MATIMANRLTGFVSANAEHGKRLTVAEAMQALAHMPSDAETPFWALVYDPVTGEVIKI